MDEIERVVAALNLSEHVHRLPEAEEQRLRAELIAEFVQGRNRRFWWEAFSKPSAEVSFLDGAGYKRIPELVSAPAEPCWFVVENLETTDYPIYDATPELSARIIGECFGFEYYLIAKDKRWLICENHHGVIVGIGPEVIEAIKRITVQVI